jgi:hypothetical protein
MIYPITILKEEYFIIEEDINRILKIVNIDRYISKESKMALNILYKKQKDLTDAMNVLEHLIITDDILSYPDSEIKKPKEH